MEAEKLQPGSLSLHCWVDLEHREEPAFFFFFSSRVAGLDDSWIHHHGDDLSLGDTMSRTVISAVVWECPPFRIILTQ